MLTKFKPKSEFSRNVLTLMTGAAMAQAIPIAISPILTRFYTPDDFGVFALFVSLSAILSVIATGKYDLSIILPSKNSDSKQLVIFTFLLSIFFSVIVFFIINLFYDQLISLNSKVSTMEWLYVLPLGILLTSGYQILVSYENKHKNYKKISISLVLQNIVAATINIVTIFVNPTFWGLILGRILGNLSSIISLLFFGKRELFKVKISTKRTKYLAERYSRFPKFSLAADFGSMVTAELPVLLFISYYSSSIVGLYSLAMRVVGAPISIFGNSVSSVFRREAAVLYAKNGNCEYIFLKTFKFLFLLSIIPFTILGIFAPEIFVVVFGENWRIAGEYTQIMTIMFFFKFIVSPLSYMFYIAERQAEDLYLHIYIAISSFLSIYLGYILFTEVSFSILFYSLNWVSIYIYTGIRSYLFAKGVYYEKDN